MSESDSQQRPEVEMVPLEPRWIPAHQAFAREAFGPQSYQSRRGYLRWLYEETPHRGRGLAEASLAVTGERVVGCMHKLRLPWQIRDQVEDVVAPHNLFVSEGFRKGTGKRLINHAYDSEKHLLLMGSASTVHRTYERMGAREIETQWLRTIVNPLSAPLVALLGKSSSSAIDRLLAGAHRLVASVRVPGPVEVRSTLGASASEVAELLNRGTRTRIRWDADLVRWRFFSPVGPRHLLVRIGARQRADLASVAIVSLGARRGLLVARTVAWSADDDQKAIWLGMAVRGALTVLGVNAWFGATSDRDVALAWKKVGFWSVKESPKDYELHNPRSLTFGEMSFTGGASDNGFEAMPIT